MIEVRQHWLKLGLLTGLSSTAVIASCRPVSVLIALLANLTAKLLHLYCPGFGGLMLCCTGCTAVSVLGDGLLPLAGTDNIAAAICDLVNPLTGSILPRSAVHKITLLPTIYKGASCVA